MNLEDHAGDVIRKARAMSSVATDSAARALGVTEQELAWIESSGEADASLNFAALGSVVGLDGAKLAGLVRGWRPELRPLHLWPGFQVITTSGDGMAVNCYLVWDVQNREAALFDTGFDAAPVLKTLAREKLSLRHIFITHSHHDHVAALAEIRHHATDAVLHSNSVHAPARHRNNPGERISVGDLTVTHRATPGHAADGVTYVVEGWAGDAPPVAMVGDAIFAGSIGRGNDCWELARRKVRSEILTLPERALLCPGHGPLTTVGEEKLHNPFF